MIAVSFSSPFFGTSRAQEAAEQLGISLLSLDITQEFLTMLPHPRYGYGKNMNPCIDCKGLIFRRAGQLMAQLGAEFIFSGEVLGQRPMSQNRQALHVVAKLSGYEDYILRPLSAKLLPPPLVLREGKLDVNSFYDFSGRGRQRQMLLAQELGVTRYPTAAGGCKLTEPAFAHRLRRLLELDPKPPVRLIELLKLGRHVRLSESATLVVGRNKAENDALERLALETDALLTVVGHKGPTGLLTTSCSSDEMRLAASIVARYSDAPPLEEVGVELVQAGRREEVFVMPIDPDEVQGLLV
ncbi:MAG: tRNA 4-thiouridine(8) synthase ThiI [Candidatus Coatesbacteria bacterium]|nr:tRNA 4-thiouridine(8) synthase ThiI [Candidatus Coatesbacteria bacterium]